MIYHILAKSDWQSHSPNQDYKAESLATEGFIHCAEQAQIAGVLERYYAGKTDLCMLCIDTSFLVAELKYEQAPNGETFPHIFGVINPEAIVEVKEI